MYLQVELTESDLKKLVIAKMTEIANVTLEESDVKIEVKSKQNYKSEWEVANFRATINRTTPL